MTAESRIQRAKECIENLTFLAVEAVDREEQIRLLVFDKKVRTQVKSQLAIEAYNDVCNSLVQFHLVRLYSIWDYPRIERNSILTAIELLDDQGVQDSIRKDIQLSRSTEVVYFLNPHENHEIQGEVERLFAEDQLNEATSVSVASIHLLRRAINFSRRHAVTERARTLKFQRDNLAHSLSGNPQTDPEVALKYREVFSFLRRSIKIIEILYCVVNGVSFSISEQCREIGREKAASLWRNYRYRNPPSQ